MGLRSPRLAFLSHTETQVDQVSGVFKLLKIGLGSYQPRPIFKERLGKHAFRNEYARKDAFLVFDFFSRKFKFYQFCLKKISHAITLIGIWAWGVPIACLFYAACLIESSHAGHPSHGTRGARQKKSK